MAEPGYSSEEEEEEEEEESGWTSYFEDFMASEKREASEAAASSSSCSFSFRDGSSMVSDAASCTAWKPHQITGEPPPSFGNLSLKRKKERRVLEDDSLEDTASSPVNSPKVGEFSLMDMKSRKKGESEDKLSGYGDYKELASEGIKEDNYVGMVDKCSELRKQGLCLVPLSMLSNYLG